MKIVRILAGSIVVLIALAFGALVVTIAADWYIKVVCGLIAMFLLLIGIGLIWKPSLAKEVAMLWPFVWP